jgi:hypothetical protein
VACVVDLFGVADFILAVNETSPALVNGAKVLFGGAAHDHLELARPAKSSKASARLLRRQ